VHHVAQLDDRLWRAHVIAAAVTSAETATPADASPASAHPAPLSTALPAPWRDRIHLAGSEFAPDFPGYLEGAVLAAERAVDALQAQRHSGNKPSSPG
jgi:hypothetical protein